MIPNAPGAEDYSYATGKGQIPVIFANKVLVKYHDTSILPNITRNDFIGGVN